MNYHKPVMFEEALRELKVRRDGRYIDCTLGDGGHTIGILERGGTVLGLDVNENALKRAEERIKERGLEERFTALRGNFKDIENLAITKGFNPVNGILYDLGYSSSQLSDEELGISFLQDQPLDMRLDPELGVTAADLLNALPEKELADLLFNYSDEKMSRKFARVIVEHRNLKKFQTTKELADLLADAASPGYEHGRIHPATRAFQALRIAVNDELENLHVSLPRAARLLLPGGRMVVISFHSLEDKMAKEFGRSARSYVDSVYDKPLEPSEAEVEENRLSRSAKMRVFEKK